MKTVFNTLIVLAIAVSAQAAEPELRGTPSELTSYLSELPQTVVLTGTAELNKPADQAHIAVTVVTEDRSLETALADNAAIRQTIATTLQDKGFAPESISASNFSSTPQYGLFKEKAKSYTVENTIKVTISTETEFQGVAAVIDSTPQAHYKGISYTSTDEPLIKIQLLRRACIAVSGKKNMYEQSLGVKLTPRTFTETGTFQQQQALHDALPQGINASSIANFSYSVPSESAPTNFDELRYTAAVSIEYEVSAP